MSISKNLLKAALVTLSVLLPVPVAVAAHDHGDCPARGRQAKVEATGDLCPRCNGQLKVPVKKRCPGGCVNGRMDGEWRVCDYRDVHNIYCSRGQLRVDGKLEPIGTCPKCRGAGRLRGPDSPCPRGCDGGYVIEEEWCPRCGGSGEV
jgi:hypothetical protein